MILLLGLTACVRSFSVSEGSNQTSSTPLCAAADFDTSSSADDTGEHITLGVTLSYHGTTNCSLPNLPLLSLASFSGQPLNVTYQTVNPTEAPEPPTVTPGDRVIAIARWRNYCEKLPEQGIRIYIEMPGGGRIDAPVVLTKGPPCLDQDQGSIAEITPFTFPP